MTATGVMGANDWLKIVVKQVDPETRTEGESLAFGVELHVGGQTAACFDHDMPALNHPFRQVFGFAGKAVLPHHMDVVLVTCAALAAPAVLRELGFEVRSGGLTRVGALGEFNGFEVYAGALGNAEQEEKLQKRVRIIYPGEHEGLLSLIAFKLQEGKRWMFLRGLSAGQARIEPDVLRMLADRLRLALRSTAGEAAKEQEDPYADLISSLTALVTLLHRVVRTMPEDTLKAEGARWLRRIERWVPRVLNALKARNGRMALMKLVMAIAFPRQRPTQDQILELFEAMGPDVEDVLDTLKEEARREAARDLCRDALREKFGPLPKRNRDQLDSASSGELRKWLLRALRVATLEEVFRFGAPPPARRAPVPPKKKPGGSRKPGGSKRQGGSKKRR